MPLTINGAAGTIAGLSSGGLEDGSITGSNIADNTITRSKISSNSVDRGPDVSVITYESNRHDVGCHSTGYDEFINFHVPRQNIGTDLVVMGHVPIGDGSSNRIGAFISVADNNTVVPVYKSTCYFASRVATNDGDYGLIMYAGYWPYVVLTTSQNVYCTLGHYSRDFSSQSPGTHYNPSKGTRTDRAQSKAAKLQFFEFDNVTFIT